MMIKHDVFKLAVPLLVSFIPSVVFGWNSTGHVVVAQIAYDNLKPQARQTVDALSQKIFNQLSESDQEKLNKDFSTASTFAKLAVLPDDWRSTKLDSIFSQFDATVPSELNTYKQQTTETWHYINLDYPATQSCHSDQSQTVVWAIDTFRQLLGNNDRKTSNATAVEMVFLEHYVGDSFQPLHDITHVDANCQDDAGGNKFCLQENSKGKCTKNLHSLWDDAVGYLSNVQDIQQTATALESSHPNNNNDSRMDNDDPAYWTKVNYGYAPYVYNLQQDSKPSDDYVNGGQTIATGQLAAAGYELAQELNNLFAS